MSCCLTHGSTYYVRTNGSAQWNGSKGASWTLAHALTNSVVAAGDTIYLYAGTYRGDFTNLHSGTPDAPITIRNYNRGRAIIDGTVAMSGGSNIWWWGLELIDSSKS